MNDMRRTLRVRRPQRQDQLFARSEVGFRTRAPLQIAQSGSQPLGFMRLGKADLEHGLVAVDEGRAPSAIVVSLAEEPRLVERARRVCQEHGVSFGTDPMLFRTAFAGFGDRHRLRRFEFAPDNYQPPFTIGDFDRAGTRRVGREIISAQIEQGADVVFTGGFTITSPHDEWLRISRDLAQMGIRARDGAGVNVPVVVPILASLSGFEEKAEQEVLVRSFSTAMPDAYLLMLDGVSEARSDKRLIAALRLAGRLRETGARVIVGRVGDLRRLWLAFGFDVEYGLGRYTRFSVSDYLGESGGGISPRFEIPQLVASVDPDLATQILESGLVDNECGCPSCTMAETLSAQVDQAPRHNAHCIADQFDEAGALTPVDRVEQLEADLIAAQYGWASLARDGLIEQVPLKIETLRRVIAGGVDEGLLPAAERAPEADAIE